ncbi:MAG: capsule assembly Wzi family protein [Balneolaceae bacterium]|nr:capsule assembly Wzi family protein [Balneolaceae bacterium]
MSAAKRLFSLIGLPAVLLLTLLPAGELRSQPVPVGDLREEQFRLVQLLTGSPASVSFTDRPLWMGTYRTALDSLQGYGDSWWAQPLATPQREGPLNFSAGLWDPIYRQTANSALPQGENNGAAWYGRGLTLELQGGAWITSDWLTITLRPHLAWQGNSDFRVPRFIPNDEDGRPIYRAQIPDIDMPFRFGPEPFATLDWGETSLRLHYRQMEIGYGKESLWWGPAVRYPLIMSNNAASLPQLFLGTRSPLALPLGLGDVEFRLMGAWPRDSDYHQRSATGGDRFLNGVHAAWSPSFAPGLSVGFSRLYYRHIPESGLRFSDYFEAVLPFQIENRERILGGEDVRADNVESNQLASLFLRWIFRESGAEFYAEYMREDTNWDLRDFLMEPHNNRAYTVGMRKVLPSGRSGIDFFSLTAEINSLVPGRVDEVRPQQFYYTHTPIRQGHTHRGEVLGAAIGPGSGSQYLGVDAYTPAGMAGFFLQRVEHNDFFHYEFYDEPGGGTGYKDIWRNWVQLRVGMKGHYRLGDFLLGGQLVWNKHFNYGRFGYGELDTDFERFEGTDIVNWHFQLEVRYLFQ